MPEDITQMGNSWRFGSGRTHPLKYVRPPLSVGVFFDGTQDNKDNTELPRTNVARLWSAYQDEPAGHYRRFYVRGIGSDHVSQDERKQLDNDLILGKAFGYGAAKRTAYALGQLRSIYSEYRDAHGASPSNVILDLFGFSRGAALARNFVNLLLRTDVAGTFFPPPTIRFLGIFDTVASIGLFDDDPDYQFHVDINKAAAIYHLVAEDEVRHHFALQSIARQPDDALMREIPTGTSTWIVEQLCPGVHADIGGGYHASRMEHAQDNNKLALVYLARMHEAAVALGVPLNPLEGGDVVTLDALDRVEKTYRCHPGLREKHLVMRFHERQLEVLAAELQSIRDALEVTLTVVGNAYGESAYLAYQNKEAQLVQVMDQIERHRIYPMIKLLDAHMGGSGRFRAFADGDYADLRGRYIHRSHSPFNEVPMMHADEAGVAPGEWPLTDLTPQERRAFLDVKAPSFKRRIFYPDPFRRAAIPASARSLLVNVKAVVSDVDGRMTEPLRGCMVDLMCERTLWPRRLGGCRTDAEGFAEFFCFDDSLFSSRKLDLYFVVSDAEGRHAVGSTTVAIAHHWDSRHNDCLNDYRYRGQRRGGFYPGYFEGFSMDHLGTRDMPLVLYLRPHSTPQPESILPKF